MPTQNRREGQLPRAASRLTAEARLLAWKIACLNLSGLLPPKAKGAARAAYQLATRKAFKSGQAIQLPGPNWAIVVEEGAVDIFPTPTPDRDEIPIKRLGPGWAFADMPDFGMTTRGARMAAATDSVIVFLDRAAFQTIIRKSPEVALRVIEMLVRRLARSERTDEEIKGLGITDSALIRLLPKLADTVGAIKGLSERDIGALIGLSRQAVSAALKRLKQRGLVEASRLHIKVVIPDQTAKPDKEGNEGNR